MTKHQEFLTKLRDLMLEYDAEIDVDYNESGCECRGGEYEVKFTSGKGVERKSSSVYDSWVYYNRVGDMI